MSGFFKIAVDEQYVMCATMSEDKEVEMVKTGENEKFFLGIKYKVPVYKKKETINTKLKLLFTNGSVTTFGFGDEAEYIKVAEEIFDRIQNKLRG
jgi:hypothetical protein